MKKSALAVVLICVIALCFSFLSCGGGGGNAFGPGGGGSDPSTQTPAFTSSASSINFGNQLANPPATLTRSVTFTNSGSADLVINAVAKSGANAADFRIDLPSLPVTLAANASLTVNVSFTPGGAGDRTAMATVTDNASGSPHSISLLGRGTLPAVASISAVQFGTQPVNASSTARPVMVNNTGDGDLIISSITASGGFTYSGNTAMTVAPGQSAALSVAFAPSAAGALNGALTLSDNAPGSPHIVSLAGTGVAAGRQQPDDASVTLSPDTISPAPGSYPKTVSVTIHGTHTLFDNGATVANFGPGATVDDGNSSGLAGGFGPVQVTGDTTATAQVSFDDTVAPGPRFVIVKTGDHLSAATFVIPPRDVPGADAGRSQVVPVGKTAYLDGSRSVAGAAIAVAGANGSTGSASNPLLSYQWTLLSAPGGSTTALADANSVRASFVIDKAGAYLIQFTVTDQNGKTSSNWVMISTTRVAPVANAGNDQFVTAGTKVQLDGSGSTDADGDSLAYQWSFVSKPEGSNATLDSSTVAPVFVADLAGDYVVQLLVDDGHGNTASDQVLISTQQTPPVADAGPNQKVNQGDQPQLDGSASHDADGNTITCSWALLAAPAGSTAQLSNAGPADCSTKPSFAVDQMGMYVAQLTVSDGTASSTATTLLTTGDPGPVAVAGPHQDVGVGDTVSLDGSNSHDADNDPLTYAWSILWKPAGSSAALNRTDAANPTFQPDAAGDYVLQLVVSDSVLTSAPSTVLVTAGTPVFHADSTLVSFPGKQTINTTSSSRSITFSNTGAGTLEITAISISGTNPGDFGYTSAAQPILVSAGATTTINVTFTPTAGGSRSATLNVTHNAGAAAAIALSGSGGVPAAQLGATALHFGNQPINTASVPPRTVTLTNNGDGNLIISNIAISGDSAFVVTPTSAQPLSPGAALTLSVTFTPTTSGSHSASLRITDNASPGVQTVTLDGTGTAPVIGTTTPSFSSVLINTSSAPVAITISNSGNDNLIVSDFTFSGANAADFAMTPKPSAFTLGAGQQRVVYVTFSPTTVGDKSAQLNIVNNTNDNPHAVGLSAKGIGPGDVGLSAAGLTFASQLMATTSATQNLTVTNNGTGDLIITGLTISGTNASDFAFPAGFTPPSVASPVTVHAGAPNNIVTFGIRFTPGLSGGSSRQALLTITDNGTPAPAQTVNLNGTATSPTVSPLSLTFANQQVNSTSSPQTVTLTNPAAGGTLAVSSWSISPNTDFTVTGPPTQSFSVLPGQNQVFSITFKPTARGARSASFTIVDNTGTHTIPLSGTGTAPIFGASPSPLDFGSQAVGIANTKALTISNTGDAPLVISAIGKSGTKAADFTFSPATLTVPAGGNGALNVTFTASVDGSESATLVLTDNASGSPHSVALQGVGHIPAPVFSASPSPLMFPDTTLGFHSAATLTISNTGEVNLHISNIVKGPAGNPQDFTYSIPVGGTGFSDCPCDVAAGADLRVNISFQPGGTQAGTRTAMLIFADNTGPGGTTANHVVNLSGNATLPSPNVSYTPPVFPNQLVGIQSAPQAVTATNTGTADLKITGLSLSGANASEFTLGSTASVANPIVVAKSGGAKGISLTFTPADTGTRTATLSITAINAFDNSPVTVAPIAISAIGYYVGNVSLNSASLGFNQEILAAGALTVSAPSQLTVTTTSSDPSKILLLPVATDANGLTMGSASFQSVVAAGKGTIDTGALPGFWIQALASSGTATITVSVSGYRPATATVTLTPSGFQLNGPNGAGANFTAVLGVDNSLSVALVQLDNSGNVLSGPKALRGGGAVSITVNSATTGVGTILNNPGVVQPGNVSNGTSSLVALHPVAAGTSVLSISQPAGHTAPAVGAQLTATVTVPSIALNPVTVGYNLQSAAIGRLNRAASGTLSVTVSSSDPSKVLLSSDSTMVGSPSLTLSVPAGSTSLPAFYVQSLASSGVVTLTASASGYSSGTANVAVRPSAFILSSSSGTGDFTTTTLSPATSLTLTLYLLDSALHPMSPGALRPGQSASVAVTSGTPGTGVISGSPALFNAGDNSNTTLSFQPQPGCTTPCTTAVSVAQPAGFTAPAVGGGMTVTVNKPTVTLLAPTAYVGQNLQVSASGSFDVPAPDNLQVIITSDNPNVRLSSSPTANGASSIMVIVPTGSGMSGTFPTYYIQGLAASGTAQLSATVKKLNNTDAGFQSVPVSVTLRPAGFVLIAPNNNVGGSYAVSVNTGVSISVRSVLLDPGTLAPDAVYEVIRGGYSASVPVTSDSPAGVVTNSPAAIAANSGSGQITVQAGALSGQSALLSAGTPAGFSTPSSGNTLTLITN